MLDIASVSDGVGDSLARISGSNFLPAFFVRFGQHTRLEPTPIEGHVFDA